jgi:hypothetical protein
MTDLERNIIECAMARYVEWKDTYPKGLLDPGNGGVKRGPGRDLIEACAAYEKARAPEPF